MFDQILNTPIELHGKNKEKQGFLLMYANTSDSIKFKRKPIARCEMCLKSITKTSQQHP